MVELNLINTNTKTVTGLRKANPGLSRTEISYIYN